MEFGPVPTPIGRLLAKDALAPGSLESRYLRGVS